MKLVSKKPVGNRQVFDIEVDDHHNFFAGGACVHNCTSEGSQRLFEKGKPKSIVDIAALTSIYRPGPLAVNADKHYCRAKNNPEKVKYAHPLVKDVLEETYGILTFQEQMMRLGSHVAGMSDKDCDRMRKAFTKKSIAGLEKRKIEVKELGKIFAEGCAKNGIAEHDAIELYQWIQHQSGYSFNASLHHEELVMCYDSNSSGHDMIAKRIDDVEPGDYVRSRDEATAEEIFVEVLQKHDHGVIEIVEIELEDGSKVRCSMDHKFRTTDGRMVPLRTILQEGASIVVG